MLFTLPLVFMLFTLLMVFTLFTHSRSTTTKVNRVNGVNTVTIWGV